MMRLRGQIRRSPLALMMSGAATLSFDQRLRAPKLRTTEEALRRDRDLIREDGRRARSGLIADHERA